MPIRACPDCGSPGVRPPRASEGGVHGASELFDRAVCPRCGWQGLPLVFEALDDYQDFLSDAQPGSA